MFRRALLASCWSILSACSSDTDARSGSTSDAADAATLASTLGGPCTSDGQCRAGQCLTEAMNSRFVGGLCTVLNVNGPEDCPAGTAYAGGTGTPACLLRCQTTSECRAGWKCCLTPGSDSIACTVPDGYCAGPVL